MTIRAVDRLDDLRVQLDAWRANGARIGLVPTMGNLHAGHLALLDELRQHCDQTVVSIFVNPTQFGPGEDYESYPRTRQSDLDKLAAAGCDLVWSPSVATMYPLDEAFLVRAPAGLADLLCGTFRPGHFDGVATVVLKLFNQVRPDVAVFGEKDFQQLLIIRQLVEDFSLPIRIRGLSTFREPDGLAMSSRNQYLTPEQRAQAPKLHETLQSLARALMNGKGWPEQRQKALHRLEEGGFKPQYLEWCSAEDLGPPRSDRPQRLLVAAQLGPARLIDNIPLAANTPNGLTA